MSMMLSFCAVLFPTRYLEWDLELNWVSFWGFSYLLIQLKTATKHSCPFKTCINFIQCRGLFTSHELSPLILTDVQPKYTRRRITWLFSLILYLISNRTGKKSDQHFLNSQWIFCGKVEIKLVKILQELTELEPKAYPKHQKGKMDKHIRSNNKINRWQAKSAALSQTGGNSAIWVELKNLNLFAATEYLSI